MTPIHWITPRLGVSGRQPLSAQHEMQQAGVLGVLNLTIRPDPHWGFQTINDGEPDDGAPKPAQWFHRGIDFANHIMNQGKLLVHCELGKNRSPSMAYAILLAQGIPKEHAYQQVCQAAGIRGIRYAADAEAATGK